MHAFPKVRDRLLRHMHVHSNYLLSLKEFIAPAPPYIVNSTVVSLDAITLNIVMRLTKEKNRRRSPF